jgi:hypothetical protein
VKALMAAAVIKVIVNVAALILIGIGLVHLTVL